MRIPYPGEVWTDRKEGSQWTATVVLHVIEVDGIQYTTFKLSGNGDSVSITPVSQFVSEWDPPAPNLPHQLKSGWFNINASYRPNSVGLDGVRAYWFSTPELADKAADRERVARFTTENGELVWVQCRGQEVLG